MNLRHLTLIQATQSTRQLEECPSRKSNKFCPFPWCGVTGNPDQLESHFSDIHWDDIWGILTGENDFAPNITNHSRVECPYCNTFCVSEGMANHVLGEHFDYVWDDIHVSIYDIR